jgi:hypothetical protein
MEKKKLIDRLVDRCLNSTGKGKAGCVPCFGAVQQPRQAAPKK